MNRNLLIVKLQQRANQNLNREHLLDKDDVLMYLVHSLMNFLRLLHIRQPNVLYLTTQNFVHPQFKIEKYFINEVILLYKILI